MQHPIKAFLSRPFVANKNKLLSKEKQSFPGFQDAVSLMFLSKNLLFRETWVLEL